MSTLVGFPWLLGLLPLLTGSHEEENRNPGVAQGLHGVTLLSPCSLGILLPKNILFGFLFRVPLRRVGGRADGGATACVRSTSARFRVAVRRPKAVHAQAVRPPSAVFTSALTPNVLLGFVFGFAGSPSFFGFLDMHLTSVGLLNNLCRRVPACVSTRSFKHIPEDATTRKH